MSPADLVLLLGSYRFDTSTERVLQDGIAQALHNSGVPFVREVRLSQRDRIDFMVGRIGVEVKIGGSFSALARQLYRYAESAKLDALVLVSSRVRLGHLPEMILGKSVVTCCLLGSLL